MTRVIAVLGASNVGKSTLVDRFAALQGAAPPPAPPGESRVVGFSHLDEAWQAIDTPGSVEFLPVALGALLAADVAVICVAPDPDAAPLAAPYLRAVEAAGTPALILVNRVDEARGRMRDLVAALQDYAAHPILLRQIPIREGDRVTGTVDLVSERAWSWRENAPSQMIALPPGLASREHEARDEMLEHLSEFDDHLLEELVEGHEPPTEEVYGLCAKALAENRMIEALLGSALHGNGVLRLLKALRHEAPQPEVLRARLQAQAGLSEPPLAAIFAGGYRKHVGRTAWIRAFEALTAARPVAGKAPGQLLPADPRDQRHLEGLGAGEIACAVKADHLAPGRLADGAAAHPAPAWLAAPAPMFERLLLPAVEREGIKLSGALATLAELDPGLALAQDPVTGGARVGVQGPLHLRLLKARLKDGFGLDVTEQDPAPAYRETISGARETAYRHKKQTGGAGQFADVRLTVAPAPRGAGFSFSETVKGGAVPRNYIPAVEAGAAEAMEKGPLGFPVADVAVTLTDGQAHSVDSSDMAFRIAGKRGVAEALAAAGPVLLQPIHKVRIHAPAAFTGAFGPIVAALKGQVLGFGPDPEARGWEVFEALVPAAALAGLAGDVRAATQGVGAFDAAFDRYEEVHGKAADRIVETSAREPA